MEDVKIAVTSRSFSRNHYLKEELLKKYPKVTFNTSGEKLKGESLVNFLQGHDRAIIALEVINNEILTNLPDLKHISKYGVGLDNINFNALLNNNVTFSWTGGVNKRSVTELTICMMISLVREVWQKSNSLKKGKWVATEARGLSGCTIGIIGLGHVGKDLVKLLKPFKPKIIAYDICEMSQYCNTNDIEQVDLSRLFAESDIISVHLPKVSSTLNFMNENRLKQMKKDSILINTSRGGIVDEEALLKCLQDGPISSCAMDVFQSEPLKENPLLSLSNFLATPHIAGSSVQGVKNMGIAAIEGLDKFIDAKWENFNEYEE
jgi:phosphoglycerate dehydrogenase-like enzyme